MVIYSQRVDTKTQSITFQTSAGTVWAGRLKISATLRMCTSD